MKGLDNKKAKAIEEALEPVEFETFTPKAIKPLRKVIKRFPGVRKVK